MSTQKTEVLFPVGRLVQGSLYEPRTTDTEGNPLKVKSGANQGQDRVDYYIAVAIPKTAGKGWWQEPWGATIHATGAAAFPQQSQTPKFAWKVEDGDSAIPNAKNRKNCDRDGWPGHWVVKFSGGFVPKLYQLDGAGNVVPFAGAPGAIRLGYYVQVSGNVAGNGSQTQSGVFINHSMILFRGYGQEIYVGPDAAAAFAGVAAQPLPAGASATPLGVSSMAAPATTLPGAVGAPGAPGVPAGVPGPAAAAPGVPGMAVAPLPGFATGPGVPGVPPAPAAPPAPPAAPVRQMTAAANGVTYDSYVKAGWNDQQLVQAGFMLA